MTSCLDWNLWVVQCQKKDNSRILQVATLLISRRIFSKIHFKVSIHSWDTKLGMPTVFMLYILRAKPDTMKLFLKQKLKFKQIVIFLPFKPLQGVKKWTLGPYFFRLYSLFSTINWKEFLNRTKNKKVTAKGLFRTLAPADP